MTAASRSILNPRASGCLAWRVLSGLARGSVIEIYPIRTPSAEAGSTLHGVGEQPQKRRKTEDDRGDDEHCFQGDWP